MEIILLWLDDVRDPFTNDWVMKYAPIPPGEIDEIVWVKNYEEFKNWVEVNGLPTAICFDHDLATSHYAPEEYWNDKYDDWLEKQNSEEKTGFDCALYLVEYCMNNDEDLPLWGVQSANPVGAGKINSLLINYLKFLEQYGYD